MRIVTKKIFAITMLGALPLLSAYAQSSGASNQLIVPNYDATTLTNAGCDPAIWNKMVADYTSKRTNERQLQNATIQQQVLSTPAAKGSSGTTSNGMSVAASCFQTTAKQIDTAMNAVNAVMTLYSGGMPDLSSLGSSIASQLGAAACKQMDYQLAGTIGSTTGSITNQANTLTGYGTGNFSTNVGSGNSVSTINLGSLASNNGTASSLSTPYVTSTNANNSNSSLSWFSKLNPFSSGNTSSGNNSSNPLK